MSESRGDTVGIAGAGAFGTALANMVAGAGRDAVLWSTDENVVAEINESHRSESRLPGITLSPRVSAVADPGELCRRARLIVVAVASGQLVTRARLLGEVCDGDTLFVHAIGALTEPGQRRGSSPTGGALPSEILVAETPALRIGALAGPALPDELCRGRYASMVCASPFAEVTAETRRLCGAPPVLRIYEGSDLAGVELSAALAGAYTIALGIADALEVGPVPRAVLVTRAVAEGARVVEAAGGDKKTFFGLAGLGNLLVRGPGSAPAGATSETAPGSRDYRLGRDLGGGAQPSVSTEGARAAVALIRVAAKVGVRAPVLAAVAAVVTGELSPGDAAAAAADTVAAAE